MSDYLYSVIGLSMIFVATTLGATLVFFFSKNAISKKLNQIFTGFAAGVMLSAAFFSLIKPALEANTTYMPDWAIVSISIILGAGFLWLIDKTVPHFHSGEGKEEGIKTRELSKTSKMFLAVTIHNIPEGLSCGIAFGVALASGNHAMIISALLLSLGMSLQNIPEGAAVSLPIKAEGESSLKAFLFGMFSGIVEPIAGVIGLFLALQIQVLMPWALAFAAGCMIYVIAEEMIPEIKSEDHNHFGVWSFVLGFVVMMALDCLQF